MDNNQCMEHILLNGPVQDIQDNMPDIQDNWLVLVTQDNLLDIQVNSLEDNQLDICHHQGATIFQEQLEHQTLLKLLELKMPNRKKTERFDRLSN